MKFNVSPKDCRFIVDKEKNKVVCICEKTRYMFWNFANSNFKIVVPVSIIKKLEMPDRFVGIATCGPNDEWNEETGRLIAFSRMKDNLCRSFFKHANTFFNWYDKQLDDAAEMVNELGARLEVNTEHRHKYIESLVGKP